MLAGHMVVNFDQDNFFIRFYQTVPPTPAGLEDVRPAAVVAKLVAQVAIPAGRMPGIIHALTDNARKYETRTGIELDWEQGSDADDTSKSG